MNKVQLYDLKELVEIFHKMNVPMKTIEDSISVAGQKILKGYL